MKIQVKEQQNMGKWPNFRENFAKIIKFEILANKTHKTSRKSLSFVILGHFCHFLPLKTKSPYIYNTIRNKIYGFTRLRDDKSWDHKIFRKCLSWPEGLPITIKIWFQAKNGPYWIFFNQILCKYKQKNNNKYGKNDPNFAKTTKFDFLANKYIKLWEKVWFLSF